MGVETEDRLRKQTGSCKEERSQITGVRREPGCITLRVMSTAKAKSFRAVLERAGHPLHWVIIRIPFDAAKLWGTRARLRVKGTINGFAFRTSLFPSRHGGHILLVNQRMQAGGNVAAGAAAKFVLEPDMEERVAVIPAELKRQLREDKALRRWFEGLNYSTRKWIGDWITDVKSKDARVRRAEQIAERLMLTMDAERELPPLLQVAFARNPRAAEGWERMSIARRRTHLLGIFYYRTPDARTRRLGKVLEDAERAAKGK
jgi:uncharacterized protein YdeI (YjbR/CyaY-like superfamily)